MVHQAMPRDRLTTTFCGPRRSHAARDPCPPRLGRGIGHGARRTVRHEPSRHLQAPQGAGARRADRPRPRRAVAAVPAHGGSAQGRRRLAGALPRISGNRASIVWKIICENCRDEGEATWTQEVAPPQHRGPGACRHAHHRRAARACFQGVDGARAGRALVGTAGLRHDALRHGHPSGRRVPLLHALAGGHRPLEARHLPRNRRTGADRLHLCLGGCGRQSGPRTADDRDLRRARCADAADTASGDVRDGRASRRSSRRLDQLLRTVRRIHEEGGRET